MRTIKSDVSVLLDSVQVTPLFFSYCMFFLKVYDDEYKTS